MTSINLLHLPEEVLLQIFTYLRVSSLQHLMLSCSKIYNLIETKLWKTLSFRDYFHFLYQTPLRFNETNLFDFQTRNESEEEANKEITDPFKDPLSEEDLMRLEEVQAQISNWKTFYINCFKKDKFNLTGFWVGDYGDHGFELLRVFHKGYYVYAKKVTGDPNIPAGRLTWKVIMDETMKIGKGEVHLAETGYRNSRWNTALIENDVPNVIKLSWQIKGFGNIGYCCTFYTVKAGEGEFDPNTMGRKFQSFINLESEELEHSLG